MADHVSYDHPYRDIDQALLSLKKGTHLIKYSRKGKPKFCPFRLSADESTLIWLSRGEERNLKLFKVSKIILGQRTAVFRRYLRPEKENLSFSLIYNNGERSLDLICKDKAEVEVWLTGLKALIGNKRNRHSRSEIPDFNDGEYAQSNRPFGAALDFTSNVRGRASLDLSSSTLDVGFDHTNMQQRLSADGFRVSVSSNPSCSSQGSGGPDDIESLGDVFVWGELWYDGSVTDALGHPQSTKIDVLTPKSLESNVVLDVHQIACGARHFALVTKQGEVFTWGEENGGRLGHGIERDFTRPQLIEFLAVINVDSVACGEHHSCAISTSGDLFTWGDGVHHVGLLGHGTDASHWIPKRVSGPLEGLQILSVACGTWHSALVTTDGRLFTFGDGSFGVLGHGDRESVTYPKEVEQLSGLKTVKVACGVWHTAAIVEVGNGTTSSKKLFTWGDGDKYRLGHGNKDTYLLPTCVSALIDYNFHQIACGNYNTVALTTSGHVFTMGSSSNGQLGNPNADGKVPCLVQDKLVGEYVEEISCGAYHVAVLTSRSEVYTWGKGANGRLGHGDLDDRKTPTLVEALKERLVRSVSCGFNFTAVICVHKWVSGADQSVCSGCRQAFGFTRKRHNCYNCGLVHCHACSSKKAVRAALAPTPSKPHRVCDACYNKLRAASTGNTSQQYTKKTTTGLRRSMDGSKTRSSKLLISQASAFQQLRDVNFPSATNSIQTALKSATPSPPPAPPFPSTSSTRPSSPYSRRPTPPRGGTPMFSRGVLDSLRKSNEVLSQEVSKLQNHIKTLKQKSDTQEEEIQKLQKNAREAYLKAGEKLDDYKDSKEFTTFIGQLKDMVEKFSQEADQNESLMALQTQILAFIKENEASSSETLLSNDSSRTKQQDTNNDETSTKDHNIYSSDPNKQDDLSTSSETTHQNTNEAPSSSNSIETSTKYNSEDNEVKGSSGSSLHNESEGSTNRGIDENRVTQEASSTSSVNNVDPKPNQDKDHEESRMPQSSSRGEGSREHIEQFEQGVYVTFIQLRNGTKVYKRVRFSKRHFKEAQAEQWWMQNKERLLRHYVLPPPATSNPGSNS